MSVLPQSLQALPQVEPDAQELYQHLHSYMLPEYCTCGIVRIPYKFLRSCDLPRGTTETLKTISLLVLFPILAGATADATVIGTYQVFPTIPAGAAAGGIRCSRNLINTVVSACSRKIAPVGLLENLINTVVSYHYANDWKTNGFLAPYDTLINTVVSYHSPND